MSEGERSLASAAAAAAVPPKKCRVRGCRRTAASFECQQCQRCIHKECSLPLILGAPSYHLALPKNVDSTTLVCCTKTCYAKLEKTMSDEIRDLWKKEDDLVMEKKQRENDAVILMLILSNSMMEKGKPSPIGCGYTFRCVSNLLDELRGLTQLKRKDRSHVEQINRLVKLIRSHLGCPSEMNQSQLFGRVWANK